MTISSTGITNVHRQNGTERAAAQNTTQTAAEHIPYANEQHQQLQRDLLAWEELVISVSFGRERRWPRKATAGGSCPGSVAGQVTFWSAKSPAQAPSCDTRTVFRILTYQVFGLGQ